MSKQSDLNNMCPAYKKHSIGTWLQSIRTWVADMAARQAENKSLLDEVHDDHAAFKSAVDETETLIEEMHDDHGTLKSGIDSMKTALKNMCLSDVGAAIGTTKTKAKSVSTATFLVNGEFKSKAATDDFWTLTGFDCTNGNYNKCLLCIDASGNAQIAAGTEAGTGAGVTLPSIPASYGVVAMLQVNPTGTGDFTGGTTELDDGTVVPNAAFTDLAFHPDTFGATPDSLTASKPSSAPDTLTASKPTAVSASIPSTLV